MPARWAHSSRSQRSASGNGRGKDRDSDGGSGMTLESPVLTTRGGTSQHSAAAPSETKHTSDRNRDRPAPASGILPSQRGGRNLANPFLRALQWSARSINGRTAFIAFALVAALHLSFILQGQWTFYDDYIVLDRMFWPFNSPFAMAHRALGRDQTLFALYLHGVSWLFGTN